MKLDDARNTANKKTDKASDVGETIDTAADMIYDIYCLYL